MTKITSIQSRTAVLLPLFVLLITVGSFATPHAVFAQEDYGYTGVSDYSGDYGSSADTCCSDYGYTGVSPDTTDYGYTGVAADTTDYGYTGVASDYTDYGYTGVAADYTDYGYTGVSPDYSYTTPTYSTTPSYSYGGSCGCSTPSYSYSTPSYSSNVYTTPGTGYVSTPTYTYVAPTGVQQQQQQQTTTAQPIIINNTNTNTNNNPNTNTLTNYAPVTPVAVAPVQYPASYVYPTYQPTYQNPLSCSIYASQNVTSAGMPTTLSWNSVGASSAYLSDGIGSVTTNGTLVARPSNSVNYVLTVYGSQGNRATCNVTISVGGSSVSLTQIPYTGFDFGPVGNSIYWAAILAFAVAAAYLLVYYRGGAFALATEMVRGRSTFRPVTFTDKPAAAVAHEAPVTSIAPVVNARLASVAQSFSGLPVAETRRATSDAMIVSHAKGTEAPRIIITRE